MTKHVTDQQVAMKLIGGVKMLEYIIIS